MSIVLIKSHLKIIFDVMGIQISREVMTSNGSVDYLCSYTNKEGKILKCCIELKNAHNTKIKDGITKQLPEYLEGENTKFAIYLILWYKGNDFDEPKEFSDINSMKDNLESIKNDKYNINITIIDCNKPISPSKL